MLCFRSAQRVPRLFEASLAQKITPAPPVPWPMASYDKVPDEWSRPTTWPPRKSGLEKAPDAPHVVLSTKFQEPWYTISIGVKEILEELGCTVYNPNTDNKARSGAFVDVLKDVESFKLPLLPGPSVSIHLSLSSEHGSIQACSVNFAAAPHSSQGAVQGQSR